nr:hypothetical protein [Tanacetum cinerariifolium]
MDINIDALYNILKQNQGDMNDALGYKKKSVMVTSDPLALVAEKTKVSKRKEKVEVQTKSKGSDDDDISDLKKITALLAKAFNRKKYYAKPTNNNLRTSSASSSTNKKPEYVKSVEKKEDKKSDEKKRNMSKVKCYNCKKEGHFAKDCKKAKVKDYNYYKTKMLLAKKDSDEQVLLAEDQAWMESNSDFDQEINANMVFMAQIEKVLSDSDESSSSAKVAYYTSKSESESEFETLEYYDNSTNYGLFVNNDDDQEIFHDAIESASENFIENHIDSQKDCDEFEVDHNDSEAKDQLIDKLIWKFNHKIAKCHKFIEKANQQKGSEADDFSELKKITALLAKAFNRRKFYFKPTNNNLITSSTSQSANTKQEFVKNDNKKVEKNDDEKKRDMSRVKCYNCKKEGHFAKDCKKVKVKDYEYYKTNMLLANLDQEINANMVFMAQIEKVLSDSEASSSSANEKISEKRIKKANQQRKDFENQNKDLQDKYDVLKNQTTTFEINNKELNEQLKELIEMSNDLLAQTKVLKEQLQVKHVVINTHAECQEKYAKLEAKRYEYMIRYSAYFDNDKQHRKQIADQEVLYDKMSVQLFE